MTTGPAVSARFAQVNVVVADMERSMAFYRLLGVEVADMPGPWNVHHRTVTNVAPSVTVEYDSAASVPNWCEGWRSGRTGVVIGFAFDDDADVDAAVASIARAGYPVLQQPHDAFFGARYAVVEDPEGNAVGIMGPLDEARRWLPEAPRTPRADDAAQGA